GIALAGRRSSMDREATWQPIVPRLHLPPTAAEMGLPLPVRWRTRGSPQRYTRSPINATRYRVAQVPGAAPGRTSAHFDWVGTLAAARAEMAEERIACSNPFVPMPLRRNQGHGITALASVRLIVNLIAAIHSRTRCSGSTGRGARRKQRAGWGSPDQCVALRCCHADPPAPAVRRRYRSEDSPPSACPTDLPTSNRHCSRLAVSSRRRSAPRLRDRNPGLSSRLP